MIISLLERVSMMSVEEYNPRHVIKVVNALQPLGKEKALEVMESYLKTHAKATDTHGLFWVLRVLFDVPAQQGFPPVNIGTPDIPPPAVPGKLPRFPILILRDIPLLLVRGYVLFGFPEPADVHISYFRIHGTPRENRLEPPASLNGFDEEFLSLWQDAYGDAQSAQALETINIQLARFSR